MTKNCLIYTILVINLKIDLLKKFNLNLGYILIETPDPNNLDYMLYKVSYQKFIDIFWSNNFLTINSRDKLWGFVTRGIVFN